MKTELHTYYKVRPCTQSSMFVSNYGRVSTNLYNLNSNPLEFLSRYGDQQFKVGENYSFSPNLRPCISNPTIKKYQKRVGSGSALKGLI